MAETGRPGDRPPEEGSADWDWLYGSGEQAAPRPTAERPGSADFPFEDAPRPTPPPEHTRIMPVQSREVQSREVQSRELPPGGPSPSGGGVPPRPPATAPEPDLRPRRRRFRFGFLKLLVLAWLVFLLAVPIWAWNAIDKVGFEPSGDRPGSQPGTTYLLVGSDSRAGLSAAERRELGTGNAAGRRTDTIMLLHVGSGPNLLVSIPRDSQVEIPGHGTSKINAAYAWGGPKLLVKTLEQSTGIRIDEYVEIGMGGVVSVVDAVGGIEICPTERMKDPLANLDIKKGCQQADGATALAFARSRHTSGLGDIDRAKHQREVVAAVGKKAASPWSVLNPVRYVSLARAGSDALRIGKGTGPIALAKFGWAMTRVTGSSGMTCGVPIADLSVRWDPERAPELFQHIIEDDTSGIPKRLCTPSGIED